jgi:hypothetical protein
MYFGSLFVVTKDGFVLYSNGFGGESDGDLGLCGGDLGGDSEGDFGECGGELG